MTIIVMPELGEDVTEGLISQWLKKEGDHVERDEPLLEVVTDKVNAEMTSEYTGILRRILAGEGETVAVGAPIAELESDATEHPGA